MSSPTTLAPLAHDDHRTHVQPWLPGDWHDVAERRAHHPLPSPAQPATTTVTRPSVMQLPLFPVLEMLHVLEGAADLHATVECGDLHAAIYSAPDGRVLGGLTRKLYIRSDGRMFGFTLAPTTLADVVGTVSGALLSEIRRDHAQFGGTPADIRLVNQQVRPSVQMVFRPERLITVVLYRRSELERHLHG